MWLNIRDNLVRFLLQRMTKIVYFRKKKSLALWAKQKQHLLQLKNDPSMQNSYLGLSFRCFPSIQDTQNVGITSKICVCQDIFHNNKLCIISLRWADKKSSHGKTHSQKRCKTNTRISPTEYCRQNLISFGSKNSFWEHIKLLLPQTMEAECLPRSPEAPNTIDLFRERLTDHNSPKGMQKHLQVFPKMVTTYTQKLHGQGSQIYCV